MSIDAMNNANEPLGKSASVGTVLDASTVLSASRVHELEVRLVALIREAHPLRIASVLRRAEVDARSICSAAELAAIFDRAISAVLDER